MYACMRYVLVHHCWKKKKQKNKEEKYIPVTLWMVGLIKTSTMDFTNIKLPK